MEEVRAGAKLADIERDHILATLACLRGQQDPRRKRPWNFNTLPAEQTAPVCAADGVKVPEPKTGMGLSCD